MSSSSSSAASASADNAIDLSDADLARAYKSVCSEKDPNTWLACHVQDNRLSLFEIGQGGFAELKKKFKSWTTKCVYVALKLTAADHRSETLVSRRMKLLQITFTGSMVNELVRSQNAFIKSKVLPFFKSVHLTLDINGRDVDALFTEAAVAKRLQDSTAAHKPSHYNFGGPDAQDVSVEQLLKKKDDDDDDD